MRALLCVPPLREELSKLKFNGGGGLRPVGRGEHRPWRCHRVVKVAVVQVVPWGEGRDIKENKDFVSSSTLPVFSYSLHLCRVC